MKFLKNFKLNDNTRKLHKIDWVIMGIMIILYGILSFIRLGDTKVPNTYKTFSYIDDEVVVVLRDDYQIGTMRYYTGNNLGEIAILSSHDNKEYKEEQVIKIDSVFTWQDIWLNTEAKYIKFVAKMDSSTLGDVIFYDMNRAIIPVEESDSPLTDETNLVPNEISYMNSTYFDEIYYARTAYEYLHGIDVYEWTHPPLGKLLITIPIAIFGFSPFTYRLMGNLFGILLIPIMYILGKRIFKNRKWALLSGLIIMFDSFHFVHSRIALVDTFQIVFILLSVLFMKEYIDLSKNDDFKKKAIYLLLSGLFIGCAIDTKWNALYAGLGLAITFFIHLFKEYDVNVFKFLKKNITLNQLINIISIIVLIPFVLYYMSLIIINKEASSIVLLVYFFAVCCFIFIRIFMYIINDKYLMKLMLVSIASFIIIPVVIYILSYVLFPNVSYYDGTLKGIIDINKMMYDYHSGLDATHPFSSVWYEWPIMANPVWLYSGGTLSGLRMTITDIGNPSIWWFGVVAFIYLVVNSIKKKDQTSIFLLVFILSTFIPYIFIGRLMFMYHYYITLPFVMFGVVYFIKWICEKAKNDKAYYIYITLIIVTFIIFYPIVSGMPIKGDYIEALKLLPKWYF